MDAETKKSALAAIERIDGGIKTLKSLLTQDQKSNQPTQLISASDMDPTQSPKSGVVPKKGLRFYANSLSAAELGPTPDFQDGNWPEAVDPKMIISSAGEAEKQFRALQIVNLIRLPLQGKTILDCGCGEGYNANEMANSAVKVVGYDPKQDPHWAGRSKENLILTSNSTTVADHSKYDVIVLYDVLDHLVGEDPTALMKWLAGMLSDGGKIFVRTHPWTGRTGGHLYESANKAFLHLVLTPDEAIKAGLKMSEPNLKVVRPMAAYEQWFKDAGLEVDDKRVKTTPVEDFFSGAIMDRIIKVNWSGGIDGDTARKILSNQFVDYQLVKSKRA